MSASENPYVGRYRFLRGRQAVWREIARFVSRDVGPVETLLELGAGWCDFVNQFPAKRKLAFDLNPEMRAHADKDVDFRVGDATLLPGVDEGSVDLVFASNFLEHLEAEAIARLLDRVARVLRPGGRVALLQPNFRLCPRTYFDDSTHRTIFSDADLVTALLAHGFYPTRVEPALLPFSMKSRLPKWPLLVRAYLALPIRPLAAQMYVSARLCQEGRSPSGTARESR